MLTQEQIGALVDAVTQDYRDEIARLIEEGFLPDDDEDIPVKESFRFSHTHDGGGPLRDESVEINFGAEEGTFPMIGRKTLKLLAWEPSFRTISFFGDQRMAFHFKRS